MSNIVRHLIIYVYIGSVIIVNVHYHEKTNHPLTVSTQFKL